MTTETIQKIEQILNQFIQEELGNRLSQFAMLSLKSMIMAELDKLNRDKVEEKTEG